ncbi:MAG: hypothetical protein H6517_03150 [Microthrixaceae bacterium]|nr:hypothetical protein [Microthrixaceae bacterium]MCB9386806.1 hypothetical protein [Microthrixaceae bacterium]MCO5320533.1 hypothetical protein [Microthrixaceae bacterium]
MTLARHEDEPALNLLERVRARMGSDGSRQFSVKCVPARPGHGHELAHRGPPATWMLRESVL